MLRAVTLFARTPNNRSFPNSFVTSFAHTPNNRSFPNSFSFFVLHSTNEMIYLQLLLSTVLLLV